MTKNTPRVEVSRFTLANGLRVVHSYDPSTAMVAVDVLYDTGARDEERHLTGMAHLFEHLMFGGSVNVPDFDAEIEGAGGSDNAWTSNDFTNFYDTLPAQNVETAFHLESDRMLALAFDPRSLEVQRHVVIEEFKQQCLNRPYGDLGHHLRRILYGGRHPYSWPTIGLEPEHIARVTSDDVRRWFYSHYAPNNAVVAVCGNVTLERTRELAEKWFGGIPRREIAPRQLPEPQFPAGDVITTVCGPVPATAIAIAFPMEAYGTQGYLAADILTDILAAGNASRLYRRLIAANAADGLFASADASISGSEHEGMLMFNAKLTRNSEADAMLARQMMIDIAGEMTLDGNITEREIQRTANRFEAAFRFNNLSYLGKATELALAEIHGEDINDRTEERRRISPGTLTSYARKIFGTPSATVVYRPAEMP